MTTVTFYNTYTQKHQKWNPKTEGIYFVRCNLSFQEYQEVKKQANKDGFDVPQLALGSCGNPNYNKDDAWKDLKRIKDNRKNDTRVWVKTWLNSLIVVKAPCIFSRFDCHIQLKELSQV